MKLYLTRLCLCIGLLWSTLLSAQDQHKIDSLLKALPSCKEDTNKVRVLVDLSWEISYNDLKEGIRYAEQGRVLADKLHDTRGLIRAYHDLGSIYVDMGDYDKANDFLYRELSLIEKGSDKGSLGGCYIELGILYGDQLNYIRALHFDSLAYNLSRKNKALKTEAIALLNMGSLFEKLGMYQNALEINERSLQLNKKLGRPEALASAHCNLGEMQMHLQKFPEALASFKEGLSIYKREKLTYSLPFAYSCLGDYYGVTHEPVKAIQYYDSALPYLNTTGQRDLLMRLYESMSEAYEDESDFKNAHAYHKLYSALKDTLFNDTKNKEISKNEMRYEVDKIKMEEDKREAIAIQERNHLRIIMYAMILVMVILLVLGFILYRNYTLKKKNNRQLEEKNAVIEEKNKSITDSINYAKRIQTAILPSHKTIRDLLPDSFVLLKPKDIVSGDFYWMGQAAGKTVFSAVDCTGHGVPGALVSVVAYSNLNRCLKEY
ncbi:MAG TPA: tetratricopeptide repeat protein, partial [Bacteroidia bacterium]|nr:tetratricopeptide repeat protein [Bacteroidia bacterium]